MKGVKRLRVCMVCGYRPTPSGGGTEKHVYELTSGLLTRGVQVDIVCEDRSFLPDKYRPTRFTTAAGSNTSGRSRDGFPR